MIRRDFIQKSVTAGMAVGLGLHPTWASTHAEVKIGLIGLDTSHSPAFTKVINDPDNVMTKGFKVVSAYPYGSKRIESSASRIPQYTEEIKKLGVTVVDSLDAVIKASDVLMLMTNDGTLHLEQVLPVLKARKPVFIDKPVAAHLKDVIRIYEEAQKLKVPVFSSSPLRYVENVQKVRYQNSVGKVLGAEAFSPQKNEAMHTDLFWYGIHGVEILYTMMGTGCEQVMRIIEKEQDMVIGKWSDGRIGTYKGDLQTRQNYGGIAYGSEGVLTVGPFTGYQALAEKVVEFFRQGKSPVDDAETLELYTFMQAADVSKNNGGNWVSLKKVFESNR